MRKLFWVGAVALVSSGIYAGTRWEPAAPVRTFEPNGMPAKSAAGSSRYDVQTADLEAAHGSSERLTETAAINTWATQE